MSGLLLNAGALTVLGMVAQMKRRFIKETQRQDIERRRRDLSQGAKQRLDHERITAMHPSGTGPAATAKALTCRRMQVHRILNGKDPF
ncbi:hypothetical protein VSX64_16240 [Aurantimonas sp. C2-6-R+9]|uniref:hypothetical protein n=1 Tax=unclassified Aurantimonas TaxID=2638230 RepID=UPI002E19E5B1|nr:MULTISPECIES: hypothetical protein [unclassified Aurantimonas]MEC5291826.1 hypothetical protein [Aurantimonas sp. C2-3-R2]MEC5382409.1 hypothetical protein [Aurantimonas sp. C2-6-R+9]MEC5412887.1 hypothetical protein [Aurantimonas sp. C2-4-R8]